VPAQSWPPFAASELPTVADATDDFALPGPSGKRVGELLADAIRVGQKTLADILGPAVARLLQESPLNIAGLFDDGEREKLRAAFEASSTAADLLGRSRIVLHAAKFDAKGKAQFADADPLSVFAEPLPSLSSRRALGFFDALVPKLGLDPDIYGPMMERHAFTLAQATEEGLLKRVQAALSQYLGTDWQRSRPSAEAPPESGARVVQQVLDQVGVTPKNPQYCFLPGTMVEGAVLAASKASYDGPAVKIQTDDGRVLAVTINHPVLTSAGWKPAGDLKEGDDLLGYGPVVESFSARGLAGDGLESSDSATGYIGNSIVPLADEPAPPDGWTIHDQDVPARIEDVFETLLAQCPPGHNVKCPTGPLDFHGDAIFMKGEIDCVRPNRVLKSVPDAACDQCGGKLVLVEGLVDPSVSSGMGSGLFGARFDVSLSSELIAGESGEHSLAGDGVSVLPPSAHAVGMAAKIDATRFKALAKTTGGDAQLYRQLREAFPGKVSPLRVFKIERIRWTGHVYNLTTTTGFIVSQGIITSNCEMVFRTNVADAYHSGFSQQLATPAMREKFPVWQYLGIQDGREGHDHRPKFGKYYPSAASFGAVRGPRVFNCRCSAAPIHWSEWEELQSQGARLETSW
jgi:hypothetical protein